MKLKLNLLLKSSLVFVLSIHTVETAVYGVYGTVEREMTKTCMRLETSCSTYEDCGYRSGEGRCCYQGSCYAAVSFSFSSWESSCGIENMDSNCEIGLSS
ncbi:hypothetical protein O0I10_010697 [Lichtheimia ornata]|uniref:Uncharacterized protein n=1 Tax=Lichtheimia ornata TaxID=688661 RepID=A0AAD7XR37_9FUNG|nr:uncharacterized protein O0I10_010697 [Lichtheimia ornata]KAJ8653659.1 hypothetical protein O0I10_010697 [Lichtheimia ornata]